MEDKKVALRFSVGSDLVMLSIGVPIEGDISVFVDELFEKEKFPIYLRDNLERTLSSLISLHSQSELNNGGDLPPTMGDGLEEQDDEDDAFSEAFSFLCQLNSSSLQPLIQLEESMMGHTSQLFADRAAQLGILRSSQEQEMRDAAETTGQKQRGAMDELVTDHVLQMRIIQERFARELAELAAKQRAEYRSFCLEYFAIEKDSEAHRGEPDSGLSEEDALPAALATPELSWVAKIGTQIHAVHLATESLASLLGDGLDSWRPAWHFRRVRDLYSGRSAALVLPVESLQAEASEGQQQLAQFCEMAPELHFASLREQLARALADSGDAWSLGDVAVTQHSNLLLPHHIFHTQTTPQDAQALSEEQMCALLCDGALLRILKCCQTGDVSLLAIPLLMASEKDARRLIAADKWEQRARGVLRVVHEYLCYRQEVLQLPRNSDTALATIRFVLPPNCDQQVLERCCGLFREVLDLVPQ